MLARVAAGPGAEGVRLVDDQERPALLRQLAQRPVEAGLRVHDADVRERGLREHAGDVAVPELPPERLDVVPLDHPGRLIERDRRPEVRLALHDPTVAERGEGLVDGAVVAPVEDEHLRPAGHVAREPDREAVRVRGGERELPALEAEAARPAPPPPRAPPRSEASA